MTDPRERGETGPAGPDSGGPSGFQVPAQPPMEGYPTPGSGAFQGQGPPAGYPHGPPTGYPPGPYPDPFGPGQGPPAWYAQGPAGDPPGSYPDPFGPGQGPPAWYPPGPYRDPYFPPPGDPHGWSQPPQRSRPGTVTGAAVLAFVLAGFDLVGAIGTLGSVTDSGVVVDGSRFGPLVAGLASLAVGGTLIGGGVMMLRGRPTLLLVSAACSALIALFWFWSAPGLGGWDPTGRQVAYALTRFYAVVYLALAVVTIGLALSRPAQRWHPGQGPAG